MIRICPRRVRIFTNRIIFMVGWVVLLVLAGCGEVPLPSEPTAVVPQPAVTLHLGLTNDAGGLPSLLAYEKAGVGLQFTPSGSTEVLFEDLAAGQLDAILVHDIPVGWVDGVWFNPLALDGVVLVVNAANPVTALTGGQAAAIFSGRIESWQQVGGGDGLMVPVARERGSGVRTVLDRRLMGAARLTINAPVLPNSVAVAEKVVTEPNAIGFMMLGELLAATDAIHPITLDGVMPGTGTVADQSYALTTPLYFVSSAEPSGELRAFLAWLQSAEGQAQLSARYGTIR